MYCSAILLHHILHKRHFYKCPQHSKMVACFLPCLLVYFSKAKGNKVMQRNHIGSFNGLKLRLMKSILLYYINIPKQEFSFLINVLQILSRNETLVEVFNPNSRDSPLIKYRRRFSIVPHFHVSNNER